MRRFLAALAFLLAAAGPVLAADGAARPAELVMFETETCPWCRKWHREVGAVYPGSDEAKILPLRRVETRKPRPADLAGVGEIKYVPTFVIMACGTETGRIVGFNDEAMFWGELDSIMARMKQSSPPC